MLGQYLIHGIIRGIIAVFVTGKINAYKYNFLVKKSPPPFGDGQGRH